MRLVFCSFAKMLVLSVILMTLGGALATVCTPHDIVWDCGELPHLTAQFSEVTVASSCGVTNPKSLFEDLVDVSFSGLNKDKQYTLIMVDPDAPGSPEGTGWLHLIKSSISGASLAQDGNSIGTDIIAYGKPTPPKGTGNHRYFLYLYEEFGTVQAEISKRAKFDIQDFASKNNLCGPVAMNMFITKY